jgi:acyl-CoA reductase-like NAD-dependent aldehyde dehydrogenase
MQEAKPEGNAMDQLSKSPAQRALEDGFAGMFELSRSRPAATLAERLDRLARLRAAVSENEARFGQTISADFGHRSVTETAIAETLLVLGEIKHVTRHLKKWRCWRAPSPAASPSTTVCFTFAQINQPRGGVGASGTGTYCGEWGFRSLSQLKPVFYRSRFNRLADLYPP